MRALAPAMMVQGLVLGLAEISTFDEKADRFAIGTNVR